MEKYCLIFKPNHSVVFKRYLFVCLQKNLIKGIKKQINSKKWITIRQRKFLIKHIKRCQIYLFVLNSCEKLSKRIFYFTELLLNDLLFWVYAVESLLVNRSSNHKNFENKLKLLQKLNHFWNQKLLSLKWMNILKKKSKAWLIDVLSITDLLVQQLFIIILNSCIEKNLDIYSDNFWERCNNLVTIGNIQKTLQNKLCKDSQSLETIFIWNNEVKECFDLINYNYNKLLKNVPFSSKYICILKYWLQVGHIKFWMNVEVISIENFEKKQSSTLSLLLMDFAFMNVTRLINYEVIKFQKTISKDQLKNSFKNNVKLHLFYKLLHSSSNTRKLSCHFFRYINHFIIICSSFILLFSVWNKINKFLMQWGFKPHFNKSNIFLFKVNKPFEFLNYTFIYLTRTKFIKSKLLHKSKLKYKSKSKFILFVHPSRKAIVSFKFYFKKLLKLNQNISSYWLIEFLNPKIKKWIHHYSFFDAYGTLNFLWNWVYKRITIWVKWKHPKSSRILLCKYYFLMENLLKKYDLKKNSKMIEYILKRGFIKQVQQNKWNFYGISWKNITSYNYEMPRINIMLWPTSVNAMMSFKR